MIGIDRFLNSGFTAGAFFYSASTQNEQYCPSPHTPVTPMARRGVRAIETSSPTRVQSRRQHSANLCAYFDAFPNIQG
ncbi:hypothetical protein BGZ61DRAFT_466416 [Ilyonectria robusta]|uniref:uncharacterized protein n=1 Tax=Ilyonectria robusta TaxID=1079257 RepID=UPI001E8DD6A0|nr:uncharacterized protein BGZ61DRAFT_466416 [Ilyonectria robusta]KAH8656422.1 hypothetical protein BGZ61DRAFT_466416 [Ilyonectria robusta]